MRVSLPIVPVGEKDRLGGMMAEYIAEVSAIIGVRPIQAYPAFDAYWEEPDRRWPHWIKVDASVAGFALVDRGDDERFHMSEFFVAPRFRRSGVGIAAARRLIQARGGSWRITQRGQNVAAIAFWHRVLDGFVSYEEAVESTDAVRRVQMFTVPAPTRV